jgi:single-stranded DNA-binding protein
MRVHRRHELANITTLGGVNELAISGHIQHEPTLREDDDRQHVCEFVLTHTTTSPYGRRWARQRYNIQAHGELGEYYANHWQPGQAIVINGRLEHHQVDTLAGPLPNVWIVAHTIDDTLGTHPHQQHDE